MNRSSNSFSISSLWQRSNKHIAELGSLLNQIELPAIVFDLNKEQIVLGNSTFFELTAFSHSDIAGKNLNKLFPDYHTDFVSNQDSIKVEIVRRNRKPILCILSPSLLNEGSDFQLIIIKPVENSQLGFEANYLDFLIKIHELSNKLFNTTLEEIYANSLSIINKIFKTDLIFIYQYINKNTQTKKIAYYKNTLLFPELVDSKEIEKIFKTTIWVPGKRVDNEYFRLGRINQFSYILVSPIITNQKLFGYIVIADAEKPPQIAGEKYIDVIASLISSAIFYQSINITNKRQLAESAKDTYLHKNIFDSLSTGIILVNTNLEVDAINPAIEIMLGYSKKELCGEHVENVLIGTDNLYSALQAASEGIPTHNLGNSSLHRRNGEVFSAHICVYPIQEQTSIYAIVILIDDISEHEEIRMRTQQLEQRAVIGELTAIFAHEVRNPINNIYTGLQLLETKLLPEDTNLELVTRAQGDCNRLINLMESVLAFSRPMEPKYEKLDMVQFLRRIMDKWKSRLNRVNIESFFSAEDDIPKVSGDPRALEQVFTNLINNAIEVMKENGGTLAIKIGTNTEIASYKQVEITIADNGPGIPDDIKQRMFEPFVSASSKGTGLGLAITKRIITAHHGSIGVDTFPGGTIFHIIFPAVNGE